MINYNDLGKRIRERRKKLGLTQQTLAEISDLTPTNISHIECGKTKISLPSLIKIANALSSTSDELICDSLVESKTIFSEEIQRELKDMTDTELKIASDMLKSLKQSLRQRLNKNN